MTKLFRTLSPEDFDEQRRLDNERCLAAIVAILAVSPTLRVGQVVACGISYAGCRQDSLFNMEPGKLADGLEAWLAAKKPISDDT